MLYDLRKKLHRFTRIWATLFGLIWLTAVYPVCATTQPEASAQAPAAMHEHHGHPQDGQDAMDHHPTDTATDVACLDADCPVLTVVDKQAAPKPASASDGDLHTPLAVVEPLLRLPPVAANGPTAPSHLAQTPLLAFPPDLGFRVLLI